MDDDDTVVRFGRRPPPPARRQPQVRAQLCRMPGRIGSMVSADRLTLPDAMGDQYMPLAYVAVRDRADCFIGCAGPAPAAHNDKE